MVYVTSKTVLPGQSGTKNLLEKYGEKLLAVRYKYDADLNRKIKTAEIIIKKWEGKKDKRTIP